MVTFPHVPRNQHTRLECELKDGRLTLKKSVTLRFTALILLCSAVLANAQNVLIPNFWDPNERFVKPDLSSMPRLKFLTTTDFPPFNFIDRKKRLSGFNVELARAICAELEVLAKCQIQALPWEELEGALAKGDGEAVIAGLAINAESRSKYSFSRPYLQIPGRFVTRLDTILVEPVYDSLFRKSVAVVAGSEHQKYFSLTFGERTFKNFPTRQLAFNALKTGEVDAVFTDALSASFWLASAAADNCCQFSGGPYLSEDFFGRGLAIAASKDDPDLVAGFDYALKAISDKGIFKELYLRYFPLGLF